MKREFILNALFLVLVNLLVKPFYLFGIDRTVQNTVAPGVYGLYAILFSFAFLFQIVNDFGLQNYNNRHISRHPQLLGKYFPALLLLKILLGVLFLVLILLFGLIPGYTQQYPVLLSLIAVNFLLQSLILFLRSNLSGLGFYRLDSLLSTLDRLILIALMSVLLWIVPRTSYFRIEWFVYAQTGTYLLSLTLIFILLRPHLGKTGKWWNPRLVRLIIRQSYPYALVVFLMTLYTRIDFVMIERLLPQGAKEADFYAAAYRLLDALNILGYLFAGLLLPMFARLLKQPGEDAEDLARFSFKLIWAMALPLAAGIFAFRQEIMNILYELDSYYGGQILGMLMGSFVALSGSYIFGTLLTASGRLRPMNQLFIVGVVLNVSLNLWWIPRSGALGAAQATLITQSVIFLAQYFLCIRMGLIRPDFRLWIQIGFFCLLILGLVQWVPRRITLSWPLELILIISLGGLGAILFRMVDFRQLFSLKSDISR